VGEPTPPRNRDQDIPTKRGEEMGEREPLTAKPDPQPLPDEETYEPDRNPKAAWRKATY
jgi:hypothetical protein